MSDFQVDLGNGNSVGASVFNNSGPSNSGSSWRDFDLGGLLGGAVDAYGLSEALGDLRNNQDNTNQAIGNMQDYVTDNGSFSGYGVTSNVGNIGMGPNGMDYSLTPQQAHQQQYLGAGAEQMYNQALQGTDASQQRIFNQMQAQRQPAMNQQYANLQNNVYGTGTGGMRTNNYGGNSQDYAFAKAMNDGASQDMVAARGQAMAEQQQAANIAGGMQQQSYLPMESLASLGALGAQNISTEAARNQNNMQLWTELGLGGITANTNYENIANDTIGDMWSTGAQMAGAAGAGLTAGNVWDGAQGLWNSVSSLWD